MIEEQFMNKHATVFLVNGVKLIGSIVKDHELYIIVERENKQQQVFKHAISTVSLLD